MPGTAQSNGHHSIGTGGLCAGASHTRNWTLARETMSRSSTCRPIYSDSNELPQLFLRGELKMQPCEEPVARRLGYHAASKSSLRPQMAHPAALPLKAMGEGQEVATATVSAFLSHCVSSAPPTLKEEDFFQRLDTVTHGHLATRRAAPARPAARASHAGCAPAGPRARRRPPRPPVRQHTQ